MDAACKVIDAGESLVFEEVTHLSATASVVTNDDDLGIAVDLVQARWYGAHRHVLRRLDVADLPFPGFANVEQDRMGSRSIIEPFFEFAGGQVRHGQNVKRFGSRALRSDAMTVSNKSMAL